MVMKTKNWNVTQKHNSAITMKINLPVPAVGKKHSGINGMCSFCHRGPLAPPSVDSCCAILFCIFFFVCAVNVQLSGTMAGHYAPTLGPKAQWPLPPVLPHLVGHERTPARSTWMVIISNAIAHGKMDLITPPWWPEPLHVFAHTSSPHKRAHRATISVVI